MGDWISKSEATQEYSRTIAWETRGDDRPRVARGTVTRGGQTHVVVWSPREQGCEALQVGLQWIVDPHSPFLPGDFIWLASWINVLRLRAADEPGAKAATPLDLPETVTRVSAAEDDRPIPSLAWWGLWAAFALLLATNIALNVARWLGW